MTAPRNRNLLLDLIVILGGIVILLAGMGLVNRVVSTELSSFIDIIPMMLALWFITYFLNLRYVIEKSSIRAFIIILCCLTFLILLYSKFFVFNDGGYFNTLEKTGIMNEQAWAYNSINELSHHSFYNLVFKGELKQMNLGKYGVLFSYCSLMFRYGGNALTHICIWRAFHLGLVAILFLLCSAKYGVVDKRRLSMIMLVCLFLPMLDTLFAYNHDAVGYAFVALGMYIMLCSSTNSILSLIAFPIYALLFFWFRRPYAVIAVVLYFWSFLLRDRGNRSLNLFVGVTASIFVMAFFMSTIDMADFIYYDLGFIDSSEATERIGRNYLNIVLVSILGYFPWTNLLSNVQWPYALFACFQGAMNICILYYVILSYRKRITGLFTDPFPLAGIMFLLSAMALPGHMSYTSMSMPFFLSSINDVSIKKFMRTYGYMILLVFIAGYVYNALGLTGR